MTGVSKYHIHLDASTQVTTFKPDSPHELLASFLNGEIYQYDTHPKTCDTNIRLCAKAINTIEFYHPERLQSSGDGMVLRTLGHNLAPPIQQIRGPAMCSSLSLSGHGVVYQSHRNSNVVHSTVGEEFKRSERG